MNTCENSIDIDPDRRSHPGAQPRVPSWDCARQASSPERIGDLVFEDPKSRALIARAERVAPSDASILIQGATGTGKELLARHVHACSKRCDKVFVAVNCAAIAENLIESELFGHERGAFTGAAGARTGWFEAAHGGTLFLDEIGDLQLSQQVKLLRVLQEREVVRLGSQRAIPVDVRLIAATNIDLEQAVAAGRFREDLFYRLRVASLYLPPLRERPDDILPLADHFLTRYTQQLGIRHVALSPEAFAALTGYSWPGNIRELENVIHQALLVCTGTSIKPMDLAFSPALVPSDGETQSCGADGALNRFEQVLVEFFDAPQPEGTRLDERIQETIIRAAFAYCHENQSETARLLGISRNITRARLQRHKIVPR
jgi:sigma-54-specific transcriptional regulator